MPTSGERGSCTSGSTYGPPLPTRCTTSPSTPPRPATSSARLPPDDGARRVGGARAIARCARARLRGGDLLNAGLAAEARERAEHAAVELAAEADLHQLPYAHYVVALAEAQLGSVDAARDRANVARVGFSERGRTGWSLAAELVALACSPVAGATVDAARTLAGRLDESGRPLDAARARCSPARSSPRSIDRRMPEPRSSRSVDGACRQSCASACAPSARCRPSVSAIGPALRAGSSRARRGRPISTQRCVGPRSVGLSGCTRASSSLPGTNGRCGPVTPPSGSTGSSWLAPTPCGTCRWRGRRTRQLRALLDELRDVVRRRGEGEQPGPPTSREVALQRAVAERERALRTTAGHPDVGTVVRMGALREALDGRALVQFDVVDERLAAIHVAGRRAEVIDVAPIADVIAIFAAMRRALNQLAALDPRDDARQHAARRLGSLARRADALLARACASDGSIVVVPPPQLANAPWTLVPSLAGSALTVAGSATMWCTAALAPRDVRTGVLLVAGSGLGYADAEVRALCAVHRGAHASTGEEATSARVCEQLPRARLAHLATHHQHRRANPLFGSLELIDGPLFLHDLLGLSALPSVVVLSCCEAASGDTGPIGDVLGASTVMMERGTRTVVASPALVADTEETTSAMTDVHRLLRRGLGPAEALRTVRAGMADDDPAGGLVASYLSLGAG